MTNYIILGVSPFAGAVVRYLISDDGITPMDIILFMIASLVWPITIFSVLVVGIARGFMWLENQDFMNKKIGGRK